ncbi:MAG: Peptidoglycan glycosyltransferase [Pseudomonadota bacterium]|jgi:cell division protein FtsI (penicillin-binding protein 3)
MNRILTHEGRWIRLRMGLLCGLLALGLGVVVSSGGTLTLADGSAWRDMAETQRQRRLQVVPKRGTLYDRNGSALAVSVDVPSVSLDAIELLRAVSPQDQPSVARNAANRIAAALTLDPATVEKKILGKRRFAWLKRRITREEADAVRQLGSGESGDKVRGLIVEAEGQRYYPRRELAGPLLGFVSSDSEGRDGFEHAFNTELKGQVEQMRGLRDRGGRLIFSEGIEDDQAFAGHDVQLTIDQGIQFVAERELAMAARTYEAVSGSVVVVDPHTGEVLAMASWPGYNPNDYSSSDPAARRNRAVADRFEPGSTMKIFTVAAGLQHKAIQATDKMYCENGSMSVDNITIRDTHPAEWLTVSQVLAQSSNICSAKIGLSLGAQTLYESLRGFGFGESSGTGLPGESSGVLLPRSRPWVQVETAAASFGQGISTTTLQLAMATAAIANGGNLMQPALVRRITTARGELVREFAPQVRRRVVKEAVARAVSEMMVAVTEDMGTGLEAAVAGFQVAGKTATAQKSDPATGRYSLDKYIASFVGFVPAKDPVVAIAVTVDEPMVAHAGGEVAAPIFRRVAEMALKYKGLTPSGTPSVDIGGLSQAPDPANAAYALIRQAQGKAPSVQESVAQTPLQKDQLRVPDMTGWPLRRAVKETYQLGAKPRVVGSGLVRRQVPPPGAPLDKGALLTLEFEPAS